MQWNIDTLKEVGVCMDNNLCDLCRVNPATLVMVTLPTYEDRDKGPITQHICSSCHYTVVHEACVRITPQKPQDAPGSPEVSGPSSQHSD